jgi:nucleoid-associated protein YgaU
VDTITYGALGQVQIAGRGAAGSFARLYLDNTGIVTAPVGATGGWGAVLTDVAPGVYTLRVDQLDASGSVTSRFETPFQREAPEVVTAATKPAAATADTDAGTPPTAEAGAVQTEAAGTVVAAAADAAPAAVTRAAIVTVQPGFTLWQIARENYGDGAQYVKVFEANKGQIRDPDLIYPGQIFAVPDGGN